MKQIELLLEELVLQQKKKTHALARKLIPYLTDEDLLQPNDFPFLDNHPLFRHEEGVLEGLMTAQKACLQMLLDVNR